MAGADLIVDNTYRWGLVIFLATAFAVTLFRGAYAEGFPKRPHFNAIVHALIIICVSVALAPIFGESIVDALLLRAPFGFMFPDTSPHGYGWGLVFGYSWVFAHVALLAIGAVMVALGKVPPWVSGASQGNSGSGKDTAHGG